jgi:hypothetical protein
LKIRGISEIIDIAIEIAPNKGKSMSIEKRRHFRKSLHAEASIADVLGNTWSHIHFLDISRTGAAFIAPEELVSGSSRTIRFQLPSSDKRINAICKIVHCAAHSYLPGFRVGAEFVRIDTEDMELIDKFIAADGDAT